MGLFDKKFCDVCGEKIGLLGNRKLEDGNLCKNCAAKLSPWFSERRHSTLSEIKEQLAYREENRSAVAAFHATRTLGTYYKVLLDDDAKKFMVTTASKLSEANPDVLDFSQVSSCDLDIEEDRDELKQKDKDGREVSYNPPMYQYSYDFYVNLRVNHPFFDEMRFRINSSTVETGNHAMKGGAGTYTGKGADEYAEYVKTGEEIRAALLQLSQAAPQQPAAPAAPVPEPQPAQSAPGVPSGPMVCPLCGATTTPDASGHCEFCGSLIRG